MKRNSTTLINVSIDYSPRDLDGFPVVRREGQTIDLSGFDTVAEPEVQKLLADYELVASILQKHKKEGAEILNAVLDGRYETAKAKAKAVGLTEEAFREKSGGLIWWIVAGVVLAILLYPSEAK